MCVCVCVGVCLYVCVCSCDCLKKETKSLGSWAGPLEQQTVGPLKSLWSCPNLEKLDQSIFFSLIAWHSEEF